MGAARLPEEMACGMSLRAAHVRRHQGLAPRGLGHAHCHSEALMSAVQHNHKDASVLAAELFMARSHLAYLKQSRERVEEMPELEKVLGTHDGLDRAIRLMRSQVSEIESSLREMIPPDRE